MSVTLKKVRPLAIVGLFAFVLGVWPTLYSPLGEDKAGNPMRENRITGAEEIKPRGSGDWMDAAQYLQMNSEKAELQAPEVVQR